MRKLVLLLPIVFTLAACGDDSKIKDLVRQELKDPGSAQFKDTSFSADKKMACIVWNAKNSMGGYGDWNVAELRKNDSDWTVKDLIGSEQNCSETGFKAIEAEDKAEVEAQSKAIEILQNVTTPKVDARLVRAGACKSIVFDYVYHTKKVAGYRMRGDNRRVQYHEEKQKIAQAKLEAGDC